MVNVKDAMLFNVLSYLSDKLLTEGNTVATLDELYIWLSNVTTIEYIRNTLKRVRKKESALILASQNLEEEAAKPGRQDFLQAADHCDLVSSGPKENRGRIRHHHRPIKET